jgi:hypothetical protein
MLAPAVADAALGRPVSRSIGGLSASQVPQIVDIPVPRVDQQVDTLTPLAASLLRNTIAFAICSGVWGGIPTASR